MWNHIKTILSGKTSRKAAISPTVEEPIIIDVALMNAAYPDRSAGRYCDHCDQHGSHHTDRHNQFALAAQDMAAYAPANGYK